MREEAYLERIRAIRAFPPRRGTRGDCVLWGIFPAHEGGKSAVQATHRGNCDLCVECRDELRYTEVLGISGQRSPEHFTAIHTLPRLVCGLFNHQRLAGGCIGQTLAP